MTTPFVRKALHCVATGKDDNAAKACLAKIIRPSQAGFRVIKTALSFRESAERINSPDGSVYLNVERSGKITLRDITSSILWTLGTKDLSDRLCPGDTFRLYFGRPGSTSINYYFSIVRFNSNGIIVNNPDTGFPIIVATFTNLPRFPLDSSARQLAIQPYTLKKDDNTGEWALTNGFGTLDKNTAVTYIAAGSIIPTC